MKTGTKKFDAVAESRKWKEQVAADTTGLTPEQVMACFDRAAVHSRFETALQRAHS